VIEIEECFRSFFATIGGGWCTKRVDWALLREVPPEWPAVIGRDAELVSDRGHHGYLERTIVTKVGLEGESGEIWMQGIFTKGMQEWFDRNRFQVGIPTEGIDQEKWNLGDFRTRFKDFEKVAGVVGGVAGAFKLAERFRRLGPHVGKLGGAIGAVGMVLALSDFLIDTVANADDLYNALKPYASRADLIGLRISNPRVPSALKDHPRDKTF
jgi:hypothetical protein